jgi:hypothetical protein
MRRAAERPLLRRKLTFLAARDEGGKDPGDFPHRPVSLARCSNGMLSRADLGQFAIRATTLYGVVSPVLRDIV